MNLTRKLGRVLPLSMVLWLAACTGPSATEPPAPGPTEQHISAAATESIVTLAATARPPATATAPRPTPEPTATATASPTTTPTVAGFLAATSTLTATTTPTATATVALPYRPRLIGWSANGLTIEGFTFGDGPRHLIVVGGMHGGYEWNTILLSYQLVDYFAGTPGAVPGDVRLTIIPSANPDGQALVTGTHGRFTAADVSEPTGPGRFNGAGVDVNRNWDCAWQPTGLWGSRVVSAGTAPFSEPESYYLRQFLVAEAPWLVIFLHSAVPGVFPGACEGVMLPATGELAEVYAAASGYPYETGGFSSYEITGDASDYLARVGVPAFTVELEDHANPEFARNLAALEELLALTGP